MQTTGEAIARLVQLALCSFACALLTGCFFIPGKFQSELDIRRDGQFAYSYTGEVIFLFPEEPDERQWDDTMAKCTAEAKAELRACTSEEVSAQRVAFEAEKTSRREGGADIARLIGYNPLDTKANEMLASDLMLYPGWQKVEYRGQGKFYVEYRLNGILDRDFQFPVLPEVQVAMPFVNVARTKAGAVKILAAGLASQQLRRVIVGQTPKMDLDDPYFSDIQSILFQTNGTFSISTDAEIIATNGKQTQSGGLQRIDWTVDGKTSEAPTLGLVLDI